jgi:hypothetical protein
MTLLERVERRAATRNSVLRAGTIQFGDGSINCMVSNMSNAGAMLDVTSSVGIPERFALVLSPGGRHMRCHVVWRQEKRIGVWYDPFWRLGFNLKDGPITFEQGRLSWQHA